MSRKYSSNPSAAIVFSKGVDSETTADTKELNILSEYLLNDIHVHIKRETREGYLDLRDENTDAADAAQAEISKSLYVIKLSEMIQTVLDHEAHLFTASEIKILHTILRLEYHPQFLISRIALRKRGKWHRFDHLLSSYTQEFIKYMKVPEHDVPKLMADTLLKLCTHSHAGEQPSVSVDQKEVIDLTLDSDDDEPTGNPKSTANSAVPAPNASSGSTFDDASELLSLFEDSSSATPTELLECLITDELKTMAKKLKIPGKTKSIRAELIKAILRSTSTQTTLPFAIINKSSAASPQKAKNEWKRYFPFKPREIAGKKQNMPLQERRIREMCNEIYSACFRLRDEVFQVLHLVSVVYFRTTEYSESDSIMLSAILATTGKRNYPKYEYKRTTDVFEARKDVLQYMKTSELLNQVDNILEGVGQPSGEKFDRVEAAQEVIKIWNAQCDRWNSLVTYLKDKSRRQRGLERFEEGYLLTRLAYKAAECFGRLKKYDMELKLLGALLRQTRWRRSKRGRWYDRMALIYTRYMGGGDANLYKARDTLLEGLKDNLVHTGSRPMMLRRLQKLEKQLRIPQEEQYVGEDDLKTAVQIQIEGTRVFTPPILAASSKHTGTTPVPGPGIINANLTAHSIPSTAAADKQQRPKWTGKSIWLGKEGDVNVETFALEYYATLGFRGFHSEGSIVSTLFGLLFWDILFAPVPGAFETPYQSAPLDLVHDSFFTSREDIINTRLDELTNDPNAARRIIGDVDLRERERETWCIGVNWDLFERDDLLEIVDCLGGRALATICRLLSEEYGNRGGGVPDLFVWNASEKTCKFVEVKGPGDNLSETQKVWIDVLLGAGVDVEVCRVYEHGKIPIPRSAKSKKKPKAELQRRSTSRRRTPKAAKVNLKAADEDQESDQETVEEEDELWSSSEDGTGAAGLEDGATRPTTTQPSDALQSRNKHFPPGITPGQTEEPQSSRTSAPTSLPANSAAKRSALDAALDAAGPTTKKNKTEAVIESFSAAEPDEALPSLNAPTPMDTAHTTSLRPITSLPAPVLPREPMMPELGYLGSATKLTESGQAPTQGTIIPETPQATQPQPLVGCSSFVLDEILKPSSVLESPGSHADDRSNAKPNPQPNPSPQKVHVRTNKQLRDMILATPAKKTRKGKVPESSPVKSSPPRELTPKRKRKDSLAHTPAPKSISTSTATITPKTRAPDPQDDSAGTTRTLRKRTNATGARTGLAGSPKEWEKKWPDVFPQWVGELGGSSDPDYEPSQ